MRDNSIAMLTLSFAGKGKELEIIMLSDISHAYKVKIIFPHCITLT
jgi:hypothetical protein